MMTDENEDRVSKEICQEVHVEEPDLIKWNWASNEQFHKSENLNSKNSAFAFPLILEE